MFSDLTPFNAQKRSGTVAVELDGQIGDVAVRPQEFVIDIDRAHDLVERSVGGNGRLVDGRVVHLRPERAEALPLRHPPSRKACRLRVSGAYVDMHRAALERAGSVEGKDPAIAGFELRIDCSTDTESGQEQQERDCEASTKHSRGLLATTAWKSKRLVSTAPRDEPKASHLCRCRCLDRHRERTGEGDRTSSPLDRSCGR